MSQRTPLHAEHLAAGARMVPFAGWEMPLHYGSQINEHHAVRSGCGIFDVSHMALVELSGSGARESLRRLLANDVDRLPRPGHALYSCMLTDDGGVIDDLIVYWLAEGRYRAVLNASRHQTDLDWIHTHGGGDLTIREFPGQAMIAVQGPDAHGLLARVAPSLPRLGRFQAAEVGDGFYARTGYTGEDGYEVSLPGEQAVALWRSLLEVGAVPCGLGARDSLRLEAALNLYGHDMDEQTTPLESGLGWTVAWEPTERDFIGRAALQRQRSAGVPRKRVGLLLEGRGVLREGQPLFAAEREVGLITSGGFSPTLERAIGLARVDVDCPQDGLQVEIRGRRLPVTMAGLPFQEKKS